MGVVATPSTLPLSDFRAKTVGPIFKIFSWTDTAKNFVCNKSSCTIKPKFELYTPNVVQINFSIDPPFCPRSTIYFLGILQILGGLGDLGPNISETPPHLT